MPKGDAFLEGNHLVPSGSPTPPFGSVGLLRLINKHDAGGLRSNLRMALGLVGAHFQAGELHFREAVGLVHELLAVDLDADLLQTEFGQSDDVAMSDYLIRTLIVLVLVNGYDINQQLLCPERGRVNTKISNVNHVSYLVLSKMCRAVMACHRWFFTCK